MSQNVQIKKSKTLSKIQRNKSPTTRLDLTKIIRNADAK